MKTAQIIIDPAMKNNNGTKGQEYYKLFIDGRRYSCPMQRRLTMIAKHFGVKKIIVSCVDGTYKQRTIYLK